MHRRLRTTLLLPAAAAAALAWRALWHEPRRLMVRRRVLALPRWPAELAGLRVAVLSDLHAGAPQVRARHVARVARRAARLRPDLVVALGDFVDDHHRLGEPVAPEAVARALGGLRAPLGVWAVLGNHDWHSDGERVRAALAGAGVRVLEDDAREAGRGGLWVAGVADATTRDPDVAATLAAVPPDAAVLLLTHDPDLFPRVPPRVALTLAGHTHGGQVDVPVLKRRWIPSRFGERYDGGHVVEAGRHLFVSQGIGTSRWPVRLGAPPTLDLLELRPG